MGDWFQRIIDLDASVVEAEKIAIKIRDRLIQQGIIEAEMKNCVLGENGMGYPPGVNYWRAVARSSHDPRGLGINGVTIIIGRTVFDCGQGGFELTCPQCHNPI